MKQLEKNIKNSFARVKLEIENLQHQIFKINERTEDIEKILCEKEEAIKKGKKSKK